MSEVDLALAISLGTRRFTATTAAIAQSEHTDETWVSAATPLLTAPASVFIGEDGRVLVGEEAEKLAPAHPERMVRELTTRIGDDVPLVVGGRFVSAETVTAMVVRSVVDEAIVRCGRAPAVLALTHPWTWTEHRLGRLRDALAAQGLHDPVFLPEPEAAAMHHARTHEWRRGDVIAVYDLGGTSFDATVLRCTGDGDVVVAGEPVHHGVLGGTDFDDALLAHVLSTADVDIVRMAQDTTESRTALARLRHDVVVAKETLSTAGDARIFVPFSDDGTSVRITRSEFESMIAERLERSIDALEHALESAGVNAADLTAIVLSGGASRVPLVAQRVSERFDQPLLIDEDPAATAAAGAVATVLRRRLGPLDEASAGAPIPAVVVQDAFPAAGEPVPAHPAARAAFPLAVVVASGLLAGAMVLGSTTAAGVRSDEGETQLGPFMIPVGAGSPSPSVTLTPTPESAPPPDEGTDAATTLDAPDPAPPVRSARTKPRSSPTPKATTGTKQSPAKQSPTPSPNAPTKTPTPSQTPSATPTPTPTASSTPTPTATSTPSPTPTPEPTSDPTPPPTSDPTPLPSSTPPPESTPPPAEPSAPPDPPPDSTPDPTPSTGSSPPPEETASPPAL